MAGTEDRVRSLGVKEVAVGWMGKTSFERDGGGRLAEWLDGVWKREAGVSDISQISALDDWVDRNSILWVKGERRKSNFCFGGVGHHGFDSEWMLTFLERCDAALNIKEEALLPDDLAIYLEMILYVLLKAFILTWKHISI